MLEMQVKHETWLQKHGEAIRKHDEAFARIDSGLAQLVDVSLSLARTVEQNSASIKELREAQASTDYKLNALIETVDKIVRKNGHDK